MNKMPEYIGKLAEVRIIKNKQGLMTVDLFGKAQQVIECYRGRSGGSFKMVLGSEKEIENGIRHQIKRDVAYHKFLEEYLEFRFNVNKIENGMAWESFSMSTGTWYPVYQERVES